MGVSIKPHKAQLTLPIVPFERLVSLPDELSADDFAGLINVEGTLEALLTAVPNAAPLNGAESASLQRFVKGLPRGDVLRLWTRLKLLPPTLGSNSVVTALLGVYLKAYANMHAYRKL